MEKIVILALLVLLLSSCEQVTEKEVDLFCSNLNVLLIQKNVIRSNILNIQTTRTAEGGPYIPKMVSQCNNGGCEIVPLSCTGVGCNPDKSNREPILKYEPGHPDANKNGYVAYPNINIEEEKLKLEKVNLAIDFLLKSMPVKHEFFFSKDADFCFKKYQMLSNEMNFNRLLERGN